MKKEEASIPDEKYIASGAKIVSAGEAFKADVVLKVRQPTSNEVDALN